MPSAPYRKPPITEAVIAFHFSEALDARTRERFQVKRKRVFPRSEEIRSVTVTVGAQTAVDQVVNGNKLSSEDGLTILLSTSEQLSTCRLAPYTDWKTLLALARENWEALLSIIGQPRIKALSTRYLNRIDIPLRPGGAPINPREYFKIGISVPEGDFQPLPANFRLTSITRSKDARFQFNINFGTAVPVLIDHCSFLLDIDTSTLDKLPARKDEIWQLMSELHERKNACFEACLQDTARELFK